MDSEKTEDRSVSKDLNESGEKPVKFYYNREERLKKIKRDYSTKRSRFLFLSKRRTRSLLIIFVDLILISIVIYLMNRPINVFMQKDGDGVLYELNVTGIRGKKVLIGFTIKSQKDEKIVFSEPVPVSIKIISKSNDVLMFNKAIKENTILNSGESSSVIFLLNEDDLPRTAHLEFYYNSVSFPLFSRNVRF